MRDVAGRVDDQDWLMLAAVGSTRVSVMALISGVRRRVGVDLASWDSPGVPR